MSTGAQLAVLASDAMNPGSAASSVFYQVTNRDVSTAAAAYNDLTVTTALSGGNWGTVNAPAHRFIQFAASAVVSGGVSITVVCRGE